MNYDSSTTLTMHWDAGLIVVSYLTSVQASYTALQILQMRTNIWLLAVAALCLAVCGVWSMHFIGMAAMTVAADISYDLGWTIASVLFAFFPTFAAFWTLDAAMLNRRRERLRAVSKPKDNGNEGEGQEGEAKLLKGETIGEEEKQDSSSPYCCPFLSIKKSEGDIIAVENLLSLPPGDDTRDISIAAHIDALQHAPHLAVVSGGTIIALGACLMHYLGMHAMQMPGMVREIDVGVVVASCIIALFAGTAALYFGFVLPSTREYTLPTAMIAGAAVSGMHYVGMYGIRYVDPFLSSEAHHLNNNDLNTTVSSSSSPSSMPHAHGSSSSLSTFVLYIVFASGVVSFASLSFSTHFYRQGLRRAADEAEERVGLIVAGKLRELAALTSSSDQSRTDPLMLRLKLANTRLGAQMLKLRSFLPPSLLAQFEMVTSSSSSDDEGEAEDEDGEGNHRDHDDDDDEEEKRHHSNTDNNEVDLMHSELGRGGEEGKGDTATSDAFDEGELSGFHNTSTSASVSPGHRPSHPAAGGVGNLGTSPRVSFFLMPPGHIGDSGNEDDQHQPIALSPSNVRKQKLVGGGEEGGAAADPSSLVATQGQGQGLATSASLHLSKRTNTMLATSARLLMKKKLSKSIESAAAAVACSVSGNVREARRQQRQFGGGLTHKNVAILSLNCHGFTEIFMGDTSSSTSVGPAHLKSTMLLGVATVARANGGLTFSNNNASPHTQKSFEALYADFTRVLSAVAKAHRGVLDIVHGDRVLMSFNASMSNASYGKSAATAAIQLARDVSAICGGVGGGGPCVSVGIASGRARVGNMGSTDDIMKFNICGPVVGHAVRAQELAYALHEEHGVHIAGLVTDEMRLAVRSRAVDIVHWRHMRSPMIVSEIVGSLSSFAVTGGNGGGGQNDGCDEWMYELETKVSNDPFTAVNRAFSRMHGLIVRRHAAAVAAAAASGSAVGATANTTSAALPQIDFVGGKSTISESSVNSLSVSAHQNRGVASAVEHNSLRKSNNNTTTTAQLMTIHNNNNNSVFLDAIMSLRNAKLSIANNNKAVTRTASSGGASPSSSPASGAVVDIVAPCLCSNCRSQRPQRTLTEILEFTEAALLK